MATLLNPPTAQPRTRGTFKPLHLWHLASLDAPTVAVAWAWAFAWAAHVRFPLWSAAALALIVWTIYIADRLLDARATFHRPGAHDLRDRHHFHWRHRRILLPLAALTGLAAAALVFSQLPARSLRPDSLIAAATLLWLTSVHAQRRPESAIKSSGFSKLRYPIVVGLLFTLGCALPVSSQLAAAHSLSQFLKLPLLPLAAYAALAALNLRAIAVWESTPRKSRPQSSIQIPALFLAPASLALAAFSAPRPAAILAAASSSALLLLFLDRIREKLSPLTLRAAADLVLLTPLLLAPAAILSR